MLQNTKIGPLDLITPGELSDSLHHVMIGHDERRELERVRGLKLMKLPLIKVTATGTTVALDSAQSGAVCGPEQGFIWRILRITVASSGLTDAAVFALYGGSDLTAQQTSLIDNNGATGLPVNKAYYPSNRALWLWPGEELYANISTATAGNMYSLTGIAIEAPFEMQGKLLS
jgi:hypothetical protein